ncbi:MAG: metallophosphoesterase [Spirochaetaceae bacterium]|jgi:hypothetical protein|nr:metallophosphoesterase [Spirochaetaceae bacterium]
MYLAIGDVHGRTFWKKHLSEDFTEFYILGDYFDGYTTDFSGEYKNFKEICSAARSDERIKLCIGNHDYHYLSGIIPQRYSRFQQKHYRAINEILEENIDMLKVVYIAKNEYIVSHAGLSATFLKKMKDDYGVKEIEDINSVFIHNRNILTFNGFNIYGDDATQSPIWIRPPSLLKDPAPEFNQITGHTQFPKISGAISATGTKIIFIDTGERESIYEF